MLPGCYIFLWVAKPIPEELLFHLAHALHEYLDEGITFRGYPWSNSFDILQTLQRQKLAKALNAGISGTMSSVYASDSVFKILFKTRHMHSIATYRRWSRFNRKRSVQGLDDHNCLRWKRWTIQAIQTNYVTEL